MPRFHTLPDAPTRAYGEKLLHAVKAMFKVIHRHDTLAAEDFRAALEQAKAQIIHIALDDYPPRIVRLPPTGLLSRPCSFVSASILRAVSISDVRPGNRSPVAQWW